MEIMVPSERVPVMARADVLVCGAGASGIAAAVAAARHGCEVILLERWPSVGGMATNALVNIWHRSDRTRVVIDGLVEEATRRAEKQGWALRYSSFPRSHETHSFDPEGMRIVWNRMLEEAGVRTICYLAAGEPLLKEGRIQGVLADSKVGRRAILADVTIDATGDGDIAAKAGLRFELGRPSDGLAQGMTLMFALCGIDEEEARAGGPEIADRMIECMRSLRDDGLFPEFNEGNARGLLRMSRQRQFGHPHYWNMCPAAGNALDEEELSRCTRESREKILSYLELWRREMPGYAHAEIEQTGFAMGVRESRRIEGIRQLDAEMVLEARKQIDAIGHGVWMIDIHDPKGTGYTTYTDRNSRNMVPEGDSYHIPLGMCLNMHVPNLGVVGRCAWSTHEAHASVRVQTHGMVMGQGVGTAAGLALASGCDLLQVDTRSLQRALIDDGVYLRDVPEG